MVAAYAGYFVGAALVLVGMFVGAYITRRP